MEALNRQETEDLIIDLYYNQKKTFREIQKIARKSPRDIRAILNRVEPERSSLSIPSQAYKMFSERKSLNVVAITLNIREPEATQFYLEYWKLNQLYTLNQIYEETKGNFSSLIELYRQMKAAGMSVADAIRVLRMGNNELSSVEYKCQELRKKESSLQAGNQNAARTFQDLSDQISDEYKTLDQYRALVEQKKQDSQRLNLRKIRLEQLVECFLNSNEAYLSIKETIKREVEHTLAEPTQLLKFALISIIKSSRKDPRSFYALSYNMNIPTTTLATQAPSKSDDNSQFDYMPFVNEQYISSDCNNDNEPTYKEVLLAESEALYNKIVDEVINKATNCTAS